MENPVEAPGKLAIVEAVGSVLWFTMDGCWMMNLHPTYFAVPAIALHVAAVWMARHDRGELLIWSATLAWLCMNVLWMVSEVHKMPLALTAAKVFFFTGALFVALALATRPDVLASFRRLRSPAP